MAYRRLLRRCPSPAAAAGRSLLLRKPVRQTNPNGQLVAIPFVKRYAYHVWIRTLFMVLADRAYGRSLRERRPAPTIIAAPIRRLSVGEASPMPIRSRAPSTGVP